MMLTFGGKIVLCRGEQSSLLEELNESPVRSPVSLSPVVTGSGSGSGGGLLPHFDDHPAVLSASASGGGGGGQQLLIDVDFPSSSAAAVAATTTTAGTPLLPPTKSGMHIPVCLWHLGLERTLSVSAHTFHIPSIPRTQTVSIDDLLGGLNLSAPASSGSGQLRTVRHLPTFTGL
jgi:hypothetical protein